MNSNPNQGLVCQYVVDTVNTPSTSAYNPQSGRNPMYHSTGITRRSNNNNNNEFRLVIYLDPAATGGGGVEVRANFRRNPNDGSASVSNVNTNTNSPGPRTREMMDALRRTRQININPNGRLSFNGNGSQLRVSPEDSWTPYTEP